MSDTKTQQARLYGDQTEEHLDATIQVPAFPDQPQLIRHDSKYYLAATPVIGFGVDYLTYYEVPVFESTGQGSQTQAS